MGLSLLDLGIGLLLSLATLVFGACGDDSGVSPQTTRSPIVLVDAGHHNYHTAEGRYKAFAGLLHDQGYSIRSHRGKFTAESLKEADILVIVNALHRNNVFYWRLPTPSAFSIDEIETITRWVYKGGALFLLADHMPFPGAAKALGAALGFSLNNGFAIDSLQNSNPVKDIFRRTGNAQVSRMTDHSITRGIDSVRTFAGSAFQANDQAKPLLVFGEGAVSLIPTAAWEFEPGTPRVSISGWFQGAVAHRGKGRVALMGEARMFTDLDGVGFRSPGAEQNVQFLLNIMEWLLGKD